MDEDVIIRRDHDDGSFEWIRESDDPDVRGVWVGFERAGQWSWRIGVAAAEFVREEPLEGEFRRRIDEAIRSVAGVVDVAEEDREVWLAAGAADGEVLTRTVAAAVDAMATMIRDAIEH